jgi:Flp pilus assembly protein TadD
MKIYNTAVSLHKDWRAYNNIASIYIGENNLEEASTWLDKSFEISGNNADVLTNYGIIAARNGNLGKAQQLFNQANASEKNQAILDIRQGKYAKAERYFKNANTHNATLAKVLNGDNSSSCTDNTAACYYLNAIVGARSANMQMLTQNLSKAIAADASYKTDAANDLEFVNYRENQEFNALIK